MSSVSLPSAVPPPSPQGPIDAAYQRVLTLSALALIAFLFLLYVPFAGNYGLWDPWETHYGEVARQMAARGDYISLWWPGSPQDPATGVFWSKPVLTFWLMAVSLRLFGLGHGDLAHGNEMVLGWRGEWALRMPFVVLGILGIFATYHLVRRLVSRRAALWSAILLGTSAQWALITRQAMTDMPFVVPMTGAIVFAGLALIPHRRDPEDPNALEHDFEAELPRRSMRLGPLTLSWPDARAFYGFVAFYALCVVPQLVVNLVQLGGFTTSIFGRSYRIAGAAAVLPFVLLFFLSLYFSLQARNKRSIYLWVAYLLGGLATLAKGPAGIGMPILVLLGFLLITGRLDELWGRGRKDGTPQDEKRERGLPGILRQLVDVEDGLELGRGALVFFAVAAPWYAAMLARHGIPFWMELIGDNYVHRAQGRHGDRGTFEYYLRQLGAGLFPWSGVVAAALLQVRRYMSEGGPEKLARRQLAALCLAWFVVDFGIVTLVNTKFHHYILPALPALAILGGLLLDELTSEESAAANKSRIALLLIGVPLAFLSGRDLANFPARIGWLFNYDYVNVPNTGRPWPVNGIYGDRYEYGLPLFVFAVAGALCTALLSFTRPNPPTAPDDAAERPLPSRTVLYGLAFVGLLVIGIIAGPSLERVTEFSSSKLPPETRIPSDLRWAFLVPLTGCSVWLLALLSRTHGSRLRLGPLCMGLCGIAFTTFAIDRFLVDISPHWSQKGVFASYYRLRKGPEEPVVAWMMYWRGENLYTSNQIYDHRIDAAEKTVFLGDKNVEKLQTYLNGHRGRRIFFLIERHRIESLRSQLPESARPTLEIVDDSNNKVYLARAQL